MTSLPVRKEYTKNIDAKIPAIANESTGYFRYFLSFIKYAPIVNTASQLTILEKPLKLEISIEMRIPVSENSTNDARILGPVFLIDFLLVNKIVKKHRMTTAPNTLGAGSIQGRLASLPPSIKEREMMIKGNKNIGRAMMISTESIRHRKIRLSQGFGPLVIKSIRGMIMSKKMKG